MRHLLLALTLCLPALAADPPELQATRERLRAVHENPQAWQRVADVAPPSSASLAALRRVASDPARSAWDRTAALTLLGTVERESARARELSDVFAQLHDSLRLWHVIRARQLADELNQALARDPGDPLGPSLRLRADDVAWLSARALIARDGLATLALGHTGSDLALPPLLCVGLNRLGSGEFDPAQAALVALAQEPALREALARAVHSSGQGSSRAESALAEAKRPR